MQLLPAVLGDIFSMQSWPLGGVASEALKRILKNRVDAAREILLAEMSAGNVRFRESDVEESVAIVYRYLRAAQEGAARVNLRLLSQAMCGQASAGVLKADEFLYYADLFTSLRRDEVLLLGAVLRFWDAPHYESNIDRSERMRGTTACAQRELVPDVFADADEFSAVADGLRRTGLLATLATAGGGDLLGPSPLLLRIAKLVDFDAAGRQP
jgi:hypothetical protein